MCSGGVGPGRTAVAGFPLYNSNATEGRGGGMGEEEKREKKREREKGEKLMEHHPEYVKLQRSRDVSRGVYRAKREDCLGNC